MKILWTDGSANPNPGPGGFAVIEQGPRRKSRPVMLGSSKRTTNIQMEGWAIYTAIKYADGEECEIHTDSQFWINVLTKWAPAWEAKNWKKNGDPIKNLALVKQLYAIYSENPVKLVWVKGHVGKRLNEMADEWAKKAREGYKV